MRLAVGLDGDDTLWHNETLFSMTQTRFREMLGGLVGRPVLDERLLAVERANLRLFGYGIKGFVLSMIETAIEVTEGRVAARDIQRLIGFGKEMLEHPVGLLDGVREALERLHAGHDLVLVTKGDLFDQESKLARSGLSPLFSAIEIVSEKDEETYARILKRNGIDPARFVMVGNSVRSDILPVLAAGGRAIHVPYHLTWALEEAEPPAEGYLRAAAIREVPELVAGLAG